MNKYKGREKEYNREYYLAHKEGIDLQNKKWKEAHPEKVRGYKRKWNERNKEYYRKYRQEHAEKLKAQNRANYVKNREEILAQSKRYREAHKEETVKQWRAYQKRNWERLRAMEEMRKRTRAAIKRGDLTPQNCEGCGSEQVEIHHLDYNNPLEIMWLCKRCHAEWHRNNKAIELKGLVKEVKA